MSLHLPTLALVVCVVLLTTTVIMTLVGLTQRTYRGYWWWTAAQGMILLSAVGLLLRDAHPWLPALSVLLWLQWPMTMLTGMRQFYARTDFRTPHWMDAALLALGFWALLTLDHSLPDERAREHFIVKFGRGRDERLAQILRHEAVYMDLARLLGLRVHAPLTPGRHDGRFTM